MTEEQIISLKKIKETINQLSFKIDESIIAAKKCEKRNGAASEGQLISDLFDSFLTSYANIYNRFEHSFQKILYPISYKISSGEGNFAETTPEKEVKKIVKVSRTENGLCIQMPMLPKRVPRFASVIGVSKRHSCVIDNSSLYCYELREALYPYANFLSSFQHVFISYSFYYPKHTKNAIDSDSHDTKSVTDTIASFLPDSDSPRSCEFYYRSVFTDNVPSCTCIIVSPVLGDSTKYRLQSGFFNDF